MVKNKINETQNNLLLLIVLFAFIYAFQIVYLPISSAKIIVIIGFMTFSWILIHKDDRHIISIHSLKPFTIIILLLIYSCIITLAKQTNDFHVPYAYLLFIVEHLFGSLYIVFLLHRNRKIDIDVFFKLYIYLCLLQAIIILMMLFFPQMKYYLFNITHPENIKVNIDYGGIRLLGLAASTSYDLAIVQSFGLIFISYLLPKIEDNKNNLLLALYFLIILISVLLSGRTGYIGLAFCMIFLIRGLFISKRVRQIIIKFIIYCLIFLMIFGLCFYSIAPDELFYTVTIDANIYAFEPFYNIFGISPKYAQWLKEHHLDNGSFIFDNFIKRVKINAGDPDEFANASTPTITSSTDVLLTMYFKIPIETWMTGDGYYFDPTGETYYMQTDAGYMRHILYYGIIGSLLLYGFYIYIFIKAIKQSKKINHTGLTLLIYLIAVYIFIAHLKGDVLMGSVMIIKTIFLIYFIINCEYQHLQNKISGIKENIQMP